MVYITLRTQLQRLKLSQELAPQQVVLVLDKVRPFWH